MLTRRNFLGILAAPAIIRTADLLMPVKQIIEPYPWHPDLPLVGPSWRQLAPLPPGRYTARAVDVLMQGGRLIMHLEIPETGVTFEQEYKL